jgi:hypothetical protein
MPFVVLLFGTPKRNLARNATYRDLSYLRQEQDANRGLTRSSKLTRMG